jgi:hypothetical protein
MEIHDPKEGKYEVGVSSEIYSFSVLSYSLDTRGEKVQTTEQNNSEGRLNNFTDLELSSNPQQTEELKKDSAKGRLTKTISPNVLNLFD